MYPPPTGPQLAPDIARKLDDVYFAADPFGYFTARIASLAAGLSSEPVADERHGTAEPTLFDQLVGEVADTYRNPTPQARMLQIGVDAFAVRHHAAETLLRMAYVLLRRHNGLGTASVWADVEATPTGMAEVLEGIKDGFAGSDRWAVFRDLVYPADAADRDDPNVISGITTFAKWFDFSLRLFANSPLDLSAAHNKFKHGLGVRVRDDYLVTFATKGPDEHGDIPKSALRGGGAVNLFDQIVLQFLASPGPRRKGPPLESTTLRLSPDALLAQAALIAHTYTAMFCIAANAHFNRHENQHRDTVHVDSPEDRAAPAVAAYPGLLVNGPLPEHITSEKALAAMRQPLTKRRDGSEPREAALFYADGSWQTFRVTGPAQTGRVVDG